MTRKPITIIFIVLTFLGCTPKSEPNSIENKITTSELGDINFINFIENIPTIKLPLTIECGFQTSLYKQEFKEKFQAYIPEGYEVVGKLEAKNDKSLVLFTKIGDLLYPYLFSFEFDGQKIDSIYLHISTCAADPYIELYTWTVIDKDININMVDTAKFFYYLENDIEYIRSLDSTVLTKRTIELDNTGKFIRTKDYKERQ